MSALSERHQVFYPSKGCGDGFLGFDIRRLAGEIPLRNLRHHLVHPDMFPVHLFLRHVIPFFNPLFHHFCFSHFHLYL
jgi:hypothetical protein